MPFWKKNSKKESELKDNKQRVVVDETGIMDTPYLVLTLLLMVIGLIMLFSASYARASHNTGNPASYFVSQSIYAAIGTTVMLLVARYNYQRLQKFALIIMAGSIVLLVLVLVMGSSTNGAKRWINLGIRFQPSEIAKFAVILFFATYMTHHQKQMHTIRYGIAPYLVILGVVALLLLLEPHKSATLIILGVGFVMMFLGGAKSKHLWILVGLGILALAAYVLYKRLSGGGGDYASDRIMAWLNPDKYADDEGYQIVQSRYAIGPGGLSGVGFGKSYQKTMYLPEEHNDYIFAIVCEELGLIGAVGILLLFMMLIIRGYWISMHAYDRFGKLMAAGLTTLLAIQVFLNVGVVTNLLPPTGISLPFFSSGGTALIIQTAEMGVVLSISRWTKKSMT
ncbi:MAG: putative lipid II flippase FtsW [Clostridia bacterium]|nr:putative lipid II flippase FtsW [Clostridia bacterium]